MIELEGASKHIFLSTNTEKDKFLCDAGCPLQTNKGTKNTPAKYLSWFDIWQTFSDQGTLTLNPFKQEQVAAESKTLLQPTDCYSNCWLNIPDPMALTYQP